MGWVLAVFGDDVDDDVGIGCLAPGGRGIDVMCGFYGEVMEMDELVAMEEVL